MSDAYTQQYFGAFQSSSRSSAQVVVPLLLDWFAPASVIDLGCGVGQWLATFAAASVKEIRGVDGDYVDRQQLAIPAQQFTAHDLSQPYRPQQRYDLAMSVEVAEHLQPAQGAALVRSLVEAADVVLFSAAAPHQAGVKHINCQWPAYWTDQFRGHGYAAVDALRRRIWNDTRVDWWYRQNALLYIRQDRLARWPFLASDRTDQPLPLVHPQMLEGIVNWGMEAERKYWDLWQQSQKASSSSTEQGSA
jgi:SAM-dependent methyltransferase